MIINAKWDAGIIIIYSNAVVRMKYTSRASWKFVGILFLSVLRIASAVDLNKGSAMHGSSENNCSVSDIILLDTWCLKSLTPNNEYVPS